MARSLLLSFSSLLPAEPCEGWSIWLLTTACFVRGLSLGIETYQITFLENEANKRHDWRDAKQVEGLITCWTSNCNRHGWRCAEFQWANVVLSVLVLRIALWVGWGADVLSSWVIESCIIRFSSYTSILGDIWLWLGVPWACSALVVPLPNPLSQPTLSLSLIGKIAKNEIYLNETCFSSYTCILGDIWLWAGFPWSSSALVEWKSVEPTNPKSITNWRGGVPDFANWQDSQDVIYLNQTCLHYGHQEAEIRNPIYWTKYVVQEAEMEPLAGDSKSDSEAHNLTPGDKDRSSYGYFPASFHLF